MSVQPVQAEVIMYLLALPMAETVHATGAGAFTLTGVVQNCLRVHGGRVAQSSLEPPGVLISFGEPAHALQAAMALRDIPHEPEQGDSAPDYIVMLDAHGLTGGTSMWADMANQLRSVAQAGMIFMSVSALALLKQLPDAVTLTPVKSSAARSEEQLFEVRIERVPVTGMPAPISTFVGRETEVTQIKALLSSKRLVTISGPGGSGKTRLALFVSEEVRASFPDGVAIADLSPISDPSLVTHTLAAALGLREKPGVPLESTIIQHLSSRTVLIVLDNGEHLIEACAQLTANILISCSGITILATSREPLGVYGETIWRLAPLQVPHPDRARQADDLMRFAATRLFVERAASAHPTFRVPDAQVQVVAEICRRLDGMPLAIELAAAQVKFLSLQQISDRLHDALRLLVTRSRTAHARQQTVRLTMDWSYDLLTEEEQSLFRRLAVFSGGASLEAIEAVCVGGNVQADSILSLLAQLVDKSLVMVEEQQSLTRYRLLEIVRQYGLMRMRQFQEEEEMRRNHFHWVNALAQRAHRQLYGGQQHPLWVSRLEQELDNLMAALAWCRSGTLLPDDKVSLIVVLLRFWYVRGRSSEGLALSTAVLDESPDCSPVLKAEALRGMGILAVLYGDEARAETLFEESYAILIDLGDMKQVYSALQNMAQLAENQRRYDRAEELFGRCLAIGQKNGNQREIAHATLSSGRLAYHQQDYQRARVLVEEALQRFGETQDVLVTLALNMLGDILRELKDYKGSYRIYRETLTFWVELGNPDFLASYFEGFAILMERCGSPEEAIQLLGHCHASRQESGVHMYAHARAIYENTVADLKQRTGENTFLRLWENGQQLDLEHWVSWLQRPEAAQAFENAAVREWLTPVPKADRLTDRERDIAELVSKGLRDKEIGKILHISSRTVDGHMRSIFAKVNVPSRAALAAWTVEQRLGRV